MDGSASEIWLDEPLLYAVRHAHTKSTESFKDIHGIKPGVIHKFYTSSSPCVFIY